MQLTVGARRRRILVISPWLPEPPHWGAAIRLRELVRRLSRKNDVTLLSYVRPWDETNVPATRELCASVRTVTATWPEGADRSGRLRSLLARDPHSFRRLVDPTMQAAIDELISTGGFDLVQVESSHMTGLDVSRAPATVLTEHNIEYEVVARSLEFESSIPRKAFGLIELAKTRSAERRAWGRFDGCAVTSEREVPEVRRFNGGRPVCAVPNGVDLEYFAPQPATAASGLVFTGLMRYRANIDAVTFFVTEVLPLIHRSRPDVTLTIVGWGGKEAVRSLLGPKVIATGQVPDVRPYLAGAAAVVAPIRMGGGTRLKVLEALSMARPLVATALGCEGLDLVDGRHLLIADNPQGFADHVLRLLADQRRGEALGAAGRMAVATRYGWDHSAERLEELHDRVLAAKSEGRTRWITVTPQPQDARQAG
jgi:glycosyltransferase involved in cell wall biosynthesis